MSNKRNRQSPPAYSFKLLAHIERLREIREPSSTLPIHVILMPTNRCQCRCIYCSYQTDLGRRQIIKKQDELSFSELSKIIAALKQLDVKAITISGGGEPSMHRDFASILADIHKQKIDIGIISNGLFRDKEIISAVRNYAKWVRISIDAGQAATYNATHRTNEMAYDLIWTNVAKLARKPKKVFVGISFLLNRYNYKEISSFTQRARAAQVDMIRIGLPVTTNITTKKELKEIYNGVYDEICAVKTQLADENIIVQVDCADRLLAMRNRTMVTNTCHMRDLSFVIGADGWLYECCELAYTKKGRIIDVTKTDLRSYWLSAERISEYESKDRSPAVHCKNVLCMKTANNQFLEQVINHWPIHDNFI
jgi:MoaA/NifB/PqqE/SkfB family radical SAM enzyme